MKDYEKYARTYPVLISTLPLCLAVPYLAVQGYAVGWPELQKIGVIASSFFPLTLLTGAISWFLQDLFRWTSKLLVQFPLYGKDGMRFPTTTMLLHQTSELSVAYKRKIAQKIEQCFHLKLLSKSAELQNPQEARRVIRDAVECMRDNTRHDDLLMACNIAYGSARNAIGGCVYTLIILVAMWCYNDYDWALGIIIAIEISQGVYWAFSFSARAKEYAKALYGAFMKSSIG